MSEQNPQERLGYQADLNPVFARVSDAYDLGSFIDFRVVPVGYEDFNAVLQTENGEYFTKVFADYRSSNDIQRYVDIMEAVIAAGVNHPRLYTAKHGSILHIDPTSKLALVVMDYVKGQTFFDANLSPSKEEEQQLLAQAVIINKTPHDPPFMYDTWAITNIEPTYASVKKRLVTEDQKIIEEVIAELSAIDLANLPHCFVHGDLTKSNVLKGEDGKLYVLDFSVSNWYPRIQELAVIIGNFVNDISIDEPFLSTLKRVVAGYVDAGGELSEAEVKALPAFARAAYAMEFVGATKEKFLNGNDTQETEFWLSLGRAGLERSR